MATATAYSAYTNLQNGSEYSFGMSGSTFGGTCYVELLCTTFVPNCFDIPSGSKINSVTIKFQAKLSRSNTNLYAGRWGFKNFLHYERWNGNYPGFNLLEQMVKNGEVDRFVDYKSNDRQHETSKLTDGYKDYSFKISDLLTITEKMLSGGLRIDLDKIYQGTLDATLYIKNFRVEVDYTPPAQYYLDLNGYIDGTSAGGISPAGTADVYINGALASNDCTDYYAQHIHGSTYEIKDIKANTGWKYDGVHSGSLSGTINGTTSIVLAFSKIKHTVTVTAGTGGSVSGSGTYDYGTSVTIKATPNAGYQFVRWSDGNTNQTRTITVTSNVTYTAVFEAVQTQTRPVIVDFEIEYNGQINPIAIPVGALFTVTVTIERQII